MVSGYIASSCPTSKDLQINSFRTRDGVTLAYWEAGWGKPLIFVPAWSANGANYINVPIC